MFNYSARINRIVDGDTMDLAIDLGFRISTDIRIRLNGIDTPETFRPKSAGEKQHAKEAVAFVTSLIPPGTKVHVKTSKTGKYGRWIADITLPDNRDLVRVMLDEGFQKRAAYEL